MAEKTAVVVFSDPKSGSEEALGRLFNALFVAHELKSRQQPVSVLFQGAGTRWVFEVTKPDHPAHALYNAVSDKVIGMSGGCSDVFCAREDVAKSPIPVLRDGPIPGTQGVADISRLLDDHRILIF